MTHPVIISVEGTQRFVGEESQTVQVVTEGTMKTEGDTVYLSYEESEVTGMEGTTTVFHVEPERVTLLRMGNVSSEMVFEEGRRHMSLYSTPYGSMEVGILARKLRSTLDQNGGKLEINYDIEINHTLAGQSLFRIDVRESSPVKC